MDKQEKRFRIEGVKAQWDFLKLNLEQAEKIADFEDQESYSPNMTLSDWEKWDYELYVFEQILKKDQLVLYLEHRKQNIAFHEKHMVESDNSERTLNDVEFEIEEIQYLESEFIPKISKILTHGSFLMPPFRTKYDFLKAEYKKYLDEKKLEIVGNHFRYYHTFQPNKLKSELLRHKKLAIFPNFWLFKLKMDDPTKIAADYLKDYFRLFEHHKEKIMPLIEALHAFKLKVAEAQLECWKSSGGLFYGRSEDKRSEEEQTNDLYFSLLLIDKDYYGYK